MKKVVLLVLAFALIPAGVAVAANGLKVTGGGQVIADDQAKGPGDTIAFNAQQTSATANDNDNFPAKGQLQVNNRTEGTKFHGFVTCIRDLGGEDDGAVRFGGYQKTGDGSVVPFVVDATDNGEGGNADDDMIAFRESDDAEDPCNDHGTGTLLRDTRLARCNVQKHKQ